MFFLFTPLFIVNCVLLTNTKIMREIKFRAWNIKQNKMWESSTLQEISEKWCFSKDSLIIEQFTGLKDKNGVDIYEGDKVLVGKDEREYIVKYSNKDASFVLMYNDGIIVYNINYMTTEVIGNIHEI